MEHVNSKEAKRWPRHSGPGKDRRLRRPLPKTRATHSARQIPHYKGAFLWLAKPVLSSYHFKRAFIWLNSDQKVAYGAAGRDYTGAAQATKKLLSKWNVFEMESFYTQGLVLKNVL